MEGNSISVWDSHAGKSKQVYPVLVYAFGDTPARRGWLLGTSHVSRSGCDRCGVRSVRELPSGIPTMSSAFAGYKDPAPALKWNLASRVCGVSSPICTQCGTEICGDIWLTMPSRIVYCISLARAGMGDTRGMLWGWCCV